MCRDTVRHLVGKKPEVSGEADQSRQRHVPEPEKTCLGMVNGVNLCQFEMVKNKDCS